MSSLLSVVIRHVVALLPQQLFVIVVLFLSHVTQFRQALTLIVLIVITITYEHEHRQQNQME
jgi:hypothetical protein